VSGTGHVVLIGLMGVGKTTVGKKVAKQLGRPFVDADVELHRRTGRTVAEWFADGEPAFRRAEAAVLSEVLDTEEPTVLAAGGGVVVTDSNRRLLSRPDVSVVWLQADPAFLAGRIVQKAHRPLLGHDPLGTLTDLLAEREGWYREVADAVVEVAPAHARSSHPKRTLAEQVADAVRAREGALEAGR
jgi:shikimate kinase